MKIKGIKTTSGRYSIKKGEVKTVDKDTAKYLIDTGCAKAVKAVKEGE